MRQQIKSLRFVARDVPPGGVTTEEKSRRAQYACALPLEKFQPGDYDLSITLTTAQGSSSRSTRFTVEP